MNHFEKNETSTLPSLCTEYIPRTPSQISESLDTLIDCTLKLVLLQPFSLYGFTGLVHLDWTHFQTTYNTGRDQTKTLVDAWKYAHKQSFILYKTLKGIPGAIACVCSLVVKEPTITPLVHHKRKWNQREMEEDVTMKTLSSVRVSKFLPP
jgi:hypothetical protein